MQNEAFFLGELCNFASEHGEKKRHLLVRTLRFRELWID